MSFIGIGSPIPEIANLPGQGGAIEVLLNYSSAAECEGDLTPLTPTQAEPAGGVFDVSPSGLNINTSTGVITPAGSTPNTYTITYTVSGESSSFTFTINPLQQSTFSYSSSSFQQYSTASPIFASGTTTGGTFSATSGLVINTTTGVLDLANSTIGGPYTVTYTTPGPCATSSTFNVSVTALSTSLVDNNFALSFNGTDEYVSAGNSTTLDIASTITISAWVKTTDQDSINNIVKKDDAANNRSWNISWRGSTGGGSRLVFWNWSTDGTYNYLYTTGAPASNFADGNWHHVIATYDGTADTNGAKIYLDGVLMSQGAVSRAGTGLKITTEPVLIGTDLNGDIDEVAIWSRALDSTDVQRIYNGSSTSGKAANLFSTGLSNGLVYWNRMGD